MITLNRILVVEMYFPQPREKGFEGKVSWLTVILPLLTPPLSRASRALKKKREREKKRRTTANKTTVWTVYSTTEIMEIPRNDGHEGLLKRIAVVHVAFNSLYSHCVHSRHTVAEGAVNGVALLPIVAPPCPFNPFFACPSSPPGALFFDQLLFQNDRVWRYTACPTRGKGDTILNLKLIKLEVKRYIFEQLEM